MKKVKVKSALEAGEEYIRLKKNKDEKMGYQNGDCSKEKKQNETIINLFIGFFWVFAFAIIFGVFIYSKYVNDVNKRLSIQNETLRSIIQEMKPTEINK